MRELLIDANLLCLLVAWTARHDIDHPRLSTFSREDIETVHGIIDRFDSVVLCPQVLTETSNLLVYRQSTAMKAELRRALAGWIDAHGEENVASKEAAADRSFVRLGFTDAVLLLLAAGERTLLSTDLDLCIAAERRGLRAINYNHFRAGAVTIDQIR